jgi:hypothetical protein
MGPFPLAFTNKGFMMCNGEHTHYESCPGGTIWDIPTKACVWPDMEEGIETRIIEKPGYGGYGSTIITPPVTRIVGGYDKVLVPSRPKFISSYGGEVRRVGGYGGDVVLPAPMPETKLISEVRRVGGYGGDVVLPAPMPETKVFTEVRRGGYGSDVVVTPPVTKVITSSYGGELLPAPMPITKTLTTGYGETLPLPETKVISTGYGSTRLIPSAPIVKVASSYGGY